MESMRKLNYPIMCIKMDSVEVSKDVQRVSLDTLINDNVKYMDDYSVMQEKGYTPLRIGVTVRTVYTNKVCVSSDKNYCFELNNIPYYPHKGYDLIMYLSSLTLLNKVNYRCGFDNIMMKSEFQPIGLFNPYQDLFSPLIYSHIYLDDSLETEFLSYMKGDYFFEPICSLKKEGINGLLNTLIEVERKEN